MDIVYGNKRIEKICTDASIAKQVYGSIQEAVMIKTGHSTIAIPPGESLREQLSDRGMSQKEFAARMNMSEKHISRLINGEVRLTQETALRLEMVLGISARFWNNLEALYREDIIRVEAENAAESDLAAAEKFPYDEMAELGWISKTESSMERVFNLRKFFEVAELSLLANNQITRIACRQLKVTEKSDMTVLAWSQEARRLGRRMAADPVNIKGLPEALPKITKIIRSGHTDTVKKIRSILSKYGIVLVLLPQLNESMLCGVSFSDGDRMVIGLSEKEADDNEKLAFSLFHELAHIVLGHIDKADVSPMDEQEADEWAKVYLHQSFI